MSEKKSSPNFGEARRARFNAHPYNECLLVLCPSIDLAARRFSLWSGKQIFASRPLNIHIAAAAALSSFNSKQIYGTARPAQEK